VGSHTTQFVATRQIVRKHRHGRARVLEAKSKILTSQLFWSEGTNFATR